MRAVVNEYDDLINKMSVDSAGTGVAAHLCTARREKKNRGESKSEEGRGRGGSSVLPSKPVISYYDIKISDMTCSYGFEALLGQARLAALA